MLRLVYCVFLSENLKTTNKPHTLVCGSERFFNLTFLNKNRKMKRLFKFKYPKLTLLVLFSVAACYIFSSPTVKIFIESLNSFSYLGCFIAGIFFTFGFSTPFSIGFFAVANPDDIYLAAIIGGFGALIADLLIFKIIRFTFMDEFRRLKKTKPIKGINHILSTRLLLKIKRYLLYAFAGIIIASPLPDELGVSMLAGLTKIRIHTLAIISFIMNSLGILIILIIGARM